MKYLLLLLIVFNISTSSLEEVRDSTYSQIIEGIGNDTIPIKIEIPIISDSMINSSIILPIQNVYTVLYPSPINHHILIKQQVQEEMHIRLLNIGRQVLREQWTKALETDLYVKELSGLFIVEIEYDDGVFSKTVVIR